MTSRQRFACEHSINLVDVAKRFGECVPRAVVCYNAVGAVPAMPSLEIVDMPRKIEGPFASDVAKAYRTGESALSVGKRFGISHKTVIKIAKRAGIQTRTNKAAADIRAERMTSEQRKALTKTANRVRKSCPASLSELTNKAQIRQESLTQIGRGERALAKRLNKLGVETTLQLAVSKYNIDIATPTVAVEVLFGGGRMPSGRSQRLSGALFHSPCMP